MNQTMFVTKKVNIWLLFFIVEYLFMASRCEVFTSMANMENLVVTEKFLLMPLYDYINAEEERIKVMKKFMDKVNVTHNYMNESSINKYLGNPVNVYLMLRRMSVEWKEIEKMLKVDTPEKEGLFLIQLFLKLKLLIIPYSY